MQTAVMWSSGFVYILYVYVICMDMLQRHSAVCGATWTDDCRMLQHLFWLILSRFYICLCLRRWPRAANRFSSLPQVFNSKLLELIEEHLPDFLPFSPLTFLNKRSIIKLPILVMILSILNGFPLKN